MIDSYALYDENKCIIGIDHTKPDDVDYALVNRDLALKLSNDPRLMADYTVVVVNGEAHVQKRGRERIGHVLRGLVRFEPKNSENIGSDYVLLFLTPQHIRFQTNRPNLCEALTVYGRNCRDVHDVAFELQMQVNKTYELPINRKMYSRLEVVTTQSLEDCLFLLERV
jgi:hypothetical protein